MSAALDLPHRPIVHMTAGHPEDPEDVDFVDLRPVCWTTWPCLPADLSGLTAVVIAETRTETARTLAEPSRFDTDPPF